MAAVLLVDDRPQNLLALEAILEPLGHELVGAGSGEEALRLLLHRDDFAVILLDVQMPRLDGFETAALIKERERTRNIPIMFLTALSKDQQNVFRGYEVGAVDYVFKPFHPEILRSKVAVLIDLHEKNEQLRRQAEQIAIQELAELRRESAERYEQLADAMPQIVWTADRSGQTTYLNRRFAEYTGIDVHAVPISWMEFVHPEDVGETLRRRRETLASGEVFEFEYRFRAADGTYRWHLGRAVPIRGADDEIEFWIGTGTDIHDQKRIEEGQRFLLDAGVELARTLDRRVALEAVSKLAVPRIADVCRFDTESPACDEPQLTPSSICVPMNAHGRTFGSITLEADESGRRFDETDLGIARALAQRAALAVETSRLYEEAEYRARAARALETIADGVVLLDRDGVVQLWNHAAETITGLPRDQVIGRKAVDALPGYAQSAERVPLDGSRPETVPVEIEGRELWLSFSAVEFDEGTVFAFRDLTEERAIEHLRSDLVATVSHELRTPLAAIYGAAVTLRRPDVDVGEETRDRLLEIVESESSRLAEIVNDLLLASHLDSGRLQLAIETVDPKAVTASVVDAARTHLPEGITLDLAAPKKLPAVRADEQQLRQVLVNLVENAVKYSPDGGPVNVRLKRDDDHVLWTVSDRGLGIPASERRRVFEKFYRLDPHMTRGIGGTGLGLYICRELVHRLDGRIWVESNNGNGSTFFVQLPIAKRSRSPKRVAQAA
jgi:PAS domain S-box-containing protein